MSDCGAVSDFVHKHKYETDPEKAVALAVKVGLDLESSVIQPRKRLKKFKRISLESGETKTVSFELNNEDFSYWGENKKDWIIEKGDFEIQVNTSLTDIKYSELVKAID